MKKNASFILCMILLIISVFPLSAFADDEIHIMLQPQNYHYCEGSVAIYTVRATGTDLKFTWFLRFNGKLYDLTNGAGTSQPWEAYAGSDYGQKDSANESIYHFGGILNGLDGSRIFCQIENKSIVTHTLEAIITTGGAAMPPMIEVPYEITVEQNDKISLKCTVVDTPASDCNFQWYESGSTDIRTIKAILDRPSDEQTFEPDTSKTGTRFYFCSASKTPAGIAYSSAILVTVIKPTVKPVEVKISTKSLPDAYVGKNYSAKIETNDPKAEISIYYNPGKKNEFESTKLKLAKDGTITGIPEKSGEYTFTVQADNDSSTDYAELTLNVISPSTAPHGTTSGTETKPGESKAADTSTSATQTQSVAGASSTDTSPTVSSVETGSGTLPSESGSTKSAESSESEGTDASGNKIHFTTGTGDQTTSSKLPSWVWILVVIIVVLVAVNIGLIVKKKQ